MAPFNKDRKFGKPSFNRSDSRGPRKFGTGPRTSSGPRTGPGGFNRPGGGRSFERPSFDKQLFKATCANCGKDCEVPFKPSGQRPVYCRDCFQQQQGEDQPQQWHQRIRTADYPRDNRPRQFERPERSERFERSERPEQPRPVAGQLQQQIEQINIKLDKILKALAAAEQPKAIESPKAAEQPETAEQPRAAEKAKPARKPSKRAAARKEEVVETPVENDEE